MGDKAKAISDAFKKATRGEEQKVRYMTQDQYERYKQKIKGERTQKFVGSMTDEEKRKIAEIQKKYVAKGEKPPFKSELLRKIRGEGPPGTARAKD